MKKKGLRGEKGKRGGFVNCADKYFSMVRTALHSRIFIQHCRLNGTKKWFLHYQLYPQETG